MNKQIFWQKLILGFSIFLILTYLFIAFLPIPKEINIGLDPSWRYAISRLAETKAVFGEDIVFTYGRFGYLIRGAVTENTFWSIWGFRLIVHIILFSLVLIRLKSLDSTMEKIVLGVSVLCPYMVADKSQVLQTEYQLIYIFLLILTLKPLWETRYKRLTVISLGTAIGFLIHTKVSIGIYTVPSLLLFLSSQFINSVQDGFGHHIHLRNYMISLLDVTLSITTSTFVLFSPNFIDSFLIILFNLVVAISVSFAVKSCWKTIKTGVVIYGVYCIGLLFALLTTKPSLINYFRGYLEITSRIFKRNEYFRTTDRFSICLYRDFSLLFFCRVSCP